MGVSPLAGQIEKVGPTFRFDSLAFETNTAMNHVKRCKSTGWPNDFAAKSLEEFRTWTQPSDLAAMLELRAELSKVRIKRKGDSEVLSNALGAIQNKCEDAGVSADET